MSEGEQMGRCFSEVHECRGSPSELKIADAIDRLAADVEAIKAAVCDGSVAAERDRFLAGMGSAIKERDAAIRERDEWKEEARLAVVNRDEARAEVERLRAIVHSDAGHMAKILIENERLRAAPAAPQPAAPAAGWLTAEERTVVEDIASMIQQWFKMAWSDIDEKRCAALRSILARAGSPPVVEVPALGFAAYGFDSPFSSGEYRAGYREACLAHRDAMDKAGVKWKEVGRG